MPKEWKVNICADNVCVKVVQIGTPAMTPAPRAKLHTVSRVLLPEGVAQSSSCDVCDIIIIIIIIIGPERDENGEWRRLHNEFVPFA